MGAEVITPVRFLLGLSLGTITVLFAYKLIPLLCSSLSRPLVQLRSEDDRSIVPYPHAILLEIFCLMVCHLAGAFVFAMTGGALGILDAGAVGEVDPNRLRIAMSGGVLTVAMVRIESTRHDLDLLGTFQQLLVGWCGAFMFVWVAYPQGGQVLEQKMLLLMSGGLPLTVGLGSFIVLLVIESSIYFGAQLRFMRRIPYELARKRSDSSTVVEQELDSLSVERWTVEAAKRAISEPDSINDVVLYWVTNTHPQAVLRSIEEDVWERWKEENPGMSEADFKKWLGHNQRTIRILVPSTREGNVWGQVRHARIKACIRIVDSEEPPATRFMLLNNREALVHLSMSLPSDGRSSSNVAYRVLDPSRVAQFKGVFDVMWRYARGMNNEVQRA